MTDATNGGVSPLYFTFSEQLLLLADQPVGYRLPFSTIDAGHEVADQPRADLAQYRLILGVCH